MSFTSQWSQSAKERVQRTLLHAAERMAGVAARYHRARLDGADNLPPGAGLLVGNHGLYGYETPVFFYLLRQASGRFPVGLAERGFFRIPVIKDVLPMLGGLEGTREQAHRALEQGRLVVCYPGGAREVFKEPSARYALAWTKSVGFGRVAARAKAPVIPFAGFGVDDTFAVLPKSAVCLRLSDDPKYQMPVGMGLGPLPLPVQMHFALGKPLDPPSPHAHERVLRSFRDTVAAEVRKLLVSVCHA